MKDIFVDFNVRYGLGKVWKWKYYIAGACVIAAVLSIVFSGPSFITPEFRSTASFIPPDITSLAIRTFDGNRYEGHMIAEEEDIDRTVEFLNSIPVTDSIAAKYNLYEHYGLKKGAPNADKVFYVYYSGNVSVSYSDRSTVNIEVYDRDPQMAADIANTYLAIASEYFENITRRKEALASVKEHYQNLLSEKRALLDTMSFYRTKHDLFHFESLEAPISNFLLDKLKHDPVYAEKYDEMKYHVMRLTSLEAWIHDVEREIVHREKDLVERPSLIFTVAKARPSTFKARPKRSIIVALSVISTLAFSVFLVVLLDRPKESN